MSGEPPVPVIPPGKVGDRFVATFMTVTLVLLAAMAGLVIYLVIRRVTDVQILDGIIALPAISKPQFITPAMRAAQQAAVVKVNAKIKKAYALRNCAAAAG